MRRRLGAQDEIGTPMSLAKKGTKFAIAPKAAISAAKAAINASADNMFLLAPRWQAYTAKTKMFGGRACELIAARQDRGERYNVHQSGSIT